MNIVFRVDSSVQIGMGHLMRCLTLAEEFNRVDCQITFICRGLQANLIEYDVIRLPKNQSFQSDNLYLDWLGATQAQDAEQTIAVIPEDTDVIVVDSYALGQEWHQMLRPYTQRIVAIDDLADRQFDCDILLNQNLGVQEEDYKGKVPSNCKLLLGCDYALLRPEFAKKRVQALEKRRNTKEIANILVSVGGSDINNITYNILKQLNNNINYTVVLGGSSPHNKMLGDYAKGKNIKVIINADNMSELMFETDLAIGASGSTSWERCCLGLPTLLYVLAENQKDIANSLEQLGAVTIVQDLKNNLQTIIDDFTLWEDMSDKAKIVCDGLGVKRVVQAI